MAARVRYRELDWFLLGVVLFIAMLGLVTFVALMVQVYSLGYMGADRDYPRYFAFLNLFAFFMLTLVLANNYLFLFLGWEGVGLCSYLLIGFWFERESAAEAGKKAFLVNRVGDFGFLVGLFLLWTTFGTFHFGTLFSRVADLPVGAPVLTAVALLLHREFTGRSIARGLIFFPYMVPLISVALTWLLMFSALRYGIVNHEGPATESF